MMQGNVAFLVGIELHQRKVDDPDQREVFVRDQTELFAQVLAQIAQGVMDDLGAVGGEQNNVADLGLGDPLDLFLLGCR